MTEANMVVTQRPRGGRSATGDLVVVLAAVLAAVATWAVWTQALGVELAAGGGGGPREIGAPAVVLTSLVVGGAAAGLLRLMEAKLARGLRWWTVTAVAVWVLSLLGPLGATTASGVLGLVSLHLVVGAVVVLGLLRPARRADGVA